MCAARTGELGSVEIGVTKCLCLGKRVRFFLIFCRDRRGGGHKGCDRKKNDLCVEEGCTGVLA